MTRGKKGLPAQGSNPPAGEPEKTSAKLPKGAALQISAAALQRLMTAARNNRTYVLERLTAELPGFIARMEQTLGREAAESLRKSGEAQIAEAQQIVAALSGTEETESPAQG